MKLLGILLAIVGKVCVPQSVGHLEAAMNSIYKLPLRQRPRQTLVAALIAGEDHRFYEHRGVDPIAIAGAVYRFTIRGKVSGASTIEQQLVRVLTGRRERNLRRKLKEIVLASYLSNAYLKLDIAETYLSVAYFGWRMNGLQEACVRLSIDPLGVTFHQAASLVARLKYPQPCESTPERNALIVRRTEYILTRMSDARLCSPSEVPSDATILDI